MCVCVRACQNLLCEDPLCFGCKYFFSFIFSLNKLNVILKCMHQRDNKDKPDAQSVFSVNKNMKSYTKSRTETSGGMVDTSGCIA